MLTIEQKHLLGHLRNFSLADKDTCLLILSYSRRAKPEYGLRTLKRWGYVTQRKDGRYGITEKGLQYIECFDFWLTCGGDQKSRQRMAKISHVAALFWQFQVEIRGKIPDNMDEAYFIPSQIWRKIRDGITSTARFHGMLFLQQHRLVVYHIGDGNMDWQLFAERSLFFQNYGRYDDRATGMLLICDNGKGPEIAGNIIRNTLYNRKRLLSNPGGWFYETDKPQKYSKAPIRLHDQYSRAFLSEEQDLLFTLRAILNEEKRIDEYCRYGGAVLASKENFWDFEENSRRYLFNAANDLFKFSYLFQSLKVADNKPDARWSIFVASKYAPVMEKYESRVEVIVLSPEEYS